MRKKNKKKNRIFLKLLIFLIIVALIVGAVFIFLNKDNKKTENKVNKVAEKVESINGYEYNLYENSSDLYKKYYTELKKVLESEEIDEEQYALLVSKLFVIDFYSFDNRITNQDVGGLDFVHSSIKENFKLKATDTIYKYIKSNVYGDREQKLPVVKEVDEGTVKKTNYKYTDSSRKIDINDQNAYKVSLSWEYDNDDSGYPTSAEITLVHEKEKLLSIVIIK